MPQDISLELPPATTTSTRSQLNPDIQTGNSTPLRDTPHLLSEVFQIVLRPTVLNPSFNRLIQSSSRLKATMPSFESLPREIRDHIYNFLLVSQNPIIPYPTAYEREEILRAGGRPARPWLPDEIENVDLALRTLHTQRYSDHWPCISLLGVNSNIRHEAMDVLFSKNTWTLTLCWHMSDVVVPEIYEVYSGKFKHLTARFDMRDVPQSAILWRLKSERDVLPLQTRNPIEEPAQSHSRFQTMLEDVIGLKFAYLSAMQLNTCILDVGNLYCPGGCCRRRRLDLFGRVLELYGKLPQRISFDIDGPSFYLDHSQRTSAYADYGPGKSLCKRSMSSANSV